MSEVNYPNLTGGAKAVIREFLHDITDENKAFLVFDEIAGLHKLNADEVKISALDEFRKEIQQLATKSELIATKEALQAQIVATKETLQTQILSVREDLQGQIIAVRDDLQTQILSVRDDLQGQITATNADIKSLRGELQGLRNELQGTRNEIYLVKEALEAKIGSLEKLEARNFKFISIILGAIIVNFIAVVAVLIKSFIS